MQRCIVCGFEASDTSIYCPFDGYKLGSEIKPKQVEVISKNEVKLDEVSIIKKPEQPKAEIKKVEKVKNAK